MYNQGLEKAPHRQYGSAEPQPQLDHDHLSFSSHGNGGNDQIINVLCIHNSVQKGRKPNCPQAVQPPKRDCRQAYSVCLWLKSNYRLRAGMILPYSRITMTLNMSQFYHRSPYYIQRGINGKSGDRITETHLMVSDWGPGSFLLQLLSSLFCFVFSHWRDFRDVLVCWLTHQILNISTAIGWIVWNCVQTSVVPGELSPLTLVPPLTRHVTPPAGRTSRNQVKYLNIHKLIGTIWSRHPLFPEDDAIEVLWFSLLPSGGRHLWWNIATFGSPWNFIQTFTLHLGSIAVHFMDPEPLLLSSPGQKFNPSNTLVYDQVQRSAW